MTTKNDIWDHIKKNIRSGIPKSEFKTWLSQTSLSEITPELAVIEVPNKFVAAWLSDNYTDRIHELLKDHFSAEPTIRFSYPLPSTALGLGRKKNTPKALNIFSNNLNPAYSFSEFVTSGCNDLACSSAFNVARNPFNKYNPLYIYGKWSCGKTHLLHAIGNEAIKNQPAHEILYLPAQEIISHFEKGQMTEARKKFWTQDRPPRFLLLDDIHMLASSMKSQEELLSLCSYFLHSSRQLVVASSAAPSQIENFVPELRSRLEWGLITEITRPDQKTKMRIIQKKGEELQLNFPEDVSFFLASSSNDLKRLTGFIKKIKSRAELYENKLDISTVQAILKDNTRKPINPEMIQNITAKYFEIDRSDLLSQKRLKKFSYPRQAAIYLCRKLTDMSLKEIGKAFGNKHHSSVIYAVNNMEHQLKSNIEVLNDMNRLRLFLSSDQIR